MSFQNGMDIQAKGFVYLLILYSRQHQFDVGAAANLQKEYHIVNQAGMGQGVEKNGEKHSKCEEAIMYPNNPECCTLRMMQGRRTGRVH